MVVYVVLAFSPFPRIINCEFRLEYLMRLLHSFGGRNALQVHIQCAWFTSHSGSLDDFKERQDGERRELPCAFR